MELKCKKCGRQWDYTGDAEVYATCPDCKTSNKIEENKV